MPTKHRFHRSVCDKCGRHLMLAHKEPTYEINASKEHNKKLLSELRKVQSNLIKTGVLDARDKFQVSPASDFKIKDLLPSQPIIDHPDKFCYVANRPVSEIPIIIAKIGFKRIEDKSISELRSRPIIIDGHTRASVKLSESKDPDNVTIKAIELLFPNAESFYRSYLAFGEKFGELSLDDLIRSAHQQRDGRGWKKHPEKCPALKRR